MNDNFQIGQFGKFEWIRITKTIYKGHVNTTKQPFSIEGAQITDIDRKFIYIVDAEEQPYIVPKVSCKYTFQKPIKVA